MERTAEEGRAALIHPLFHPVEDDKKQPYQQADAYCVDHSATDFATQNFRCQLKCRAMKFVMIGLMMAAASAVVAQQPAPPPPHSLLVTKTCAIAYIHGNKRSRGHYLKDGIQSMFGENCDGSFGESGMLVPGEFRIFMHLVGAKSEYDVTCLGHIHWSAGWTSSGEHFEFDKACIIPHGKHGYWLGEFNGMMVGDWDPSAGAMAPIPEIGTYVDARWENGKLVVKFQRDYHDKDGVDISYEVVHTMDSKSRMVLDPSSITEPYHCQNGEIVVGSAVKCRPD